MAGMRSTRVKVHGQAKQKVDICRHFRAQVMKDLECQGNMSRLHLEVSGEP